MQIILPSKLLRLALLADAAASGALAVLTDPFGHGWSIATHIEDVPEDEMQRRAQQKHDG